MSWQKMIRDQEIPLGKTKPVAAGEGIVLICRTDDGELFAVEDRCSHDGASFEDSALIGRILTCPRHGARFDVASGRALSMPAVAPVDTFPVRRDAEGWVEVDVDE
jgi:3-phenylpropionate/trans-cinnamate dioxygenase ferredoxin subunit